MTFSLLQWNIWYREDIVHVVELIKQYAPDIVCLQELTLDFPGRDIADTPAYIAEQLGYNYYHKDLPIESTEGKITTLANGIFSRFPITDSHFAWINQPKQGGGYADEFRAYVEVGLDVNGKKIYVGTTHMSYTHRFEASESKQAETDLLMQELQKHDGSFIFTGDLNAVPDSYTIKKIGELMQNAGPDLSQKTWTTKPFSYNGFEETELHWRLDYVFATKNLQVESSKIITTDYSDHLPILTVFSSAK